MKATIQKISSKSLRFASSLVLCFLFFFNRSSPGHEGDSPKKIEAIHAHENLTGHAHAGWESRYFSEGRDALDGKSLWTASLELGYEHFSAGIWQGRSSNRQYEEWQYGFALTQESDGFAYYAGYTHLVFSKEDESDDEWSFGISYDRLPYQVETSLDGTYSMDAKGTFYEWALHRDFSISQRSTALFSGILGLNDGYVSDGHDGANFCALRVGVDGKFGENFLLFAHGMQSFAIDRDQNFAGDEGLVDFFHFGVGVDWNF